MSDYKLLIDGKLVSGAMALNVVNPATEELVAVAPRADRAQLEQAVAAAKAAFPRWSETSVRDRGALLARLADAVEVRQAEFAEILTAENGKPIAQAMFEMEAVVDAMRYYAGLDLAPRVLKEDASQKIIEQPMILLAAKIAPALLAGNTVVAKPAATTPLAALRLGELCADILPPGVINIIADGNDLGDALTRHPDVAKVAFTGSTATGRKVMESAAGTLKRLTLELGGNDAAIVLDDVNPKEIAPKLFAGATFNSGQGCVVIKRLFVHDSQYDEFCEELGRLAREAVVDDGAKPGAQIGPLQNKAHFERVKGFLEDAKQDGVIVAGGNVLPRKGYFIEPTIVRDIGDDSRLVREEQFGPILPVLRYAEVGDAIARANDTEFGLGGSVWSNNPERAFTVASQINSGTVWINRHLNLQPDIPFRGDKQSGIGTELGYAGLEEYTQPRIINMAKQQA
jgi:acyl-CoA reductase-like NAD-dependent aldehyde dehydrogenase